MERYILDILSPNLAQILNIASEKQKSRPPSLTQFVAGEDFLDFANPLWKHDSWSDSYKSYNATSDWKTFLNIYSSTFGH